MIQELVESTTTFTSVQVSLNDKSKAKEGILGVFQGKWLTLIIYFL